MSPSFDWFSNDPIVAKALRAADRRYEKARSAARDLPLAEKIVALRAAKADRKAADDAIRAATFSSFEGNGR